MILAFAKSSVKADVSMKLSPALMNNVPGAMLSVSSITVSCLSEIDLLRRLLSVCPAENFEKETNTRMNKGNRMKEIAEDLT